MRGPELIGCIVLAALLAGCLDTMDDPVDGMAAPSTDAPVAHIFNGTGCIVQAAVIPIAPADAYRWLPPGYTPADASDLLGIPAPTGQSALGIANAGCTDSDIGGFSFHAPMVFIQTPDIDADIPSNMVSGYAPEWYAGGAPILDIMQATHLPVSLADATLTADLEGSTVLPELRSLSQVAATWSRDGETLWSSTGTGAAPFDFQGDGFLAWTDTPEGTTIYQARLAIPAEVEQITFSVGAIRCTAAPGTPSAQLMDSTSCPTPDSLALNVLDFEFVDSGFRSFPGIHA